MYDNLVLVTRTRVVRWLPDMRSMCVTVTEGARVVVSGRAIRLGDVVVSSSSCGWRSSSGGSRPGIEHNLRHQIRRNSRRRGWTAAGIRETLLFFHLHTEMTSQQVERPPQRCASDNASRPQNLLEKYFTVLPICEACKAVKPPVVRFKKKEN